jgi:flagellar basal-body rod protein FlgG
MIEAINTSNTGLQASQSLLNVAGNNLANLNTTGFKANRVTFQDLLYAFVAGTGSGNALGPTPPGGSDFGRGVKLASTDKLFGQGPLQNTGNALDVAINGSGFFQVTRPDGTAAFTRDGAFQVDALGRLVASDGSLVQPTIVIPPLTTAINIAADGTVTVLTSNSNTPITVGRLNLVQFANPPGLIALGTNFFTASPASGQPVTTVPGQGGAGTLVQGILEGSNVDPTTELTNLLIAQQSFAFNSQAIVVENQMLQATTALVT